MVDIRDRLPVNLSDRFGTENSLFFLTAIFTTIYDTCKAQK
jgi:hypothetical protein